MPRCTMRSCLLALLVMSCHAICHAQQREPDSLGEPTLANNLDANADFSPDNSAATRPSGDDVDEAAMRIDPLINWNVPLPTSGGMQFWTDYRWWNGWRVQYNSTFKHWRLLDPNSLRRGWGDKEAMIAQLDRIRASHHADAARQLPSEDAPVVVLLHGLIRTPGSMKPIARGLQKRIAAMDASPSPVDRPTDHADGPQPLWAGVQPNIVPFTYASTRDPLPEHAAALREVIENLPGRPRWNAVGHSMGNIVLRTAIAQWQANGDPTGALQRLDRVVMLGPPNQGSSFARKLSQLGLFETITGKSGMMLGPLWREMLEHVGIPPCPFAVIAGDISSLPVQNPWLDGPSDGVVTVDEAKLDGMREFATVPVLHSFLMQDPRCVDATVEFLMGGDMQSVLAPAPQP